MSLWGRLRLLKNRLVFGAVVVSLPLVKLLSALFPKVCNNFAFMVVKPSVPGDLFPWLTVPAGRSRSMRRGSPSGTRRPDEKA